MHRRDIHPDFFKDPAVHDAHHAAAATVTLPGLALEAAGIKAVLPLLRTFRLDRLKGGTNRIAEAGEPFGSGSLPGIERVFLRICRAVIHGSSDPCWSA